MEVALLMESEFFISLMLLLMERPSLTETFSIKLGGHHLHIENTYNKGVLVGRVTLHLLKLLSHSLLRRLGTSS
jgi:hypothetical protein